MRAVAFAGENQEFVTHFGDRSWIPVGRNASEQFSGGHVEDGDSIVVRFNDQQTLTIGVERDSVGRAALGRRAGRGIVQIALDLA